MSIAFVGLGSNLGDRRKNLERACLLMKEHGLAIQKQSDIEETDPVDLLAQPKFLNQIVTIQTELSPRVLLDLLLSIENDMGRVRDLPKGPRIIDLDILLYDDIIYTDERLVIPHPAVCDRDFVLRHIIQIDSERRDPRSGVLFKEVCNGKFSDKKCS
ncbi:MAG TPA: 2-amino-4-hydroxy-6-hydroxymethyldihydropteridine diphosphokinase [Spirochaetota bacterium]